MSFQIPLSRKTWRYSWDCWRERLWRCEAFKGGLRHRLASGGWLAGLDSPTPPSSWDYPDWKSWYHPRFHCLPFQSSSHHGIQVDWVFLAELGRPWPISIRLSTLWPLEQEHPIPRWVFRHYLRISWGQTSQWSILSQEVLFECEKLATTCLA